MAYVIRVYNKFPHNTLGARLSAMLKKLGMTGRVESHTGLDLKRARLADGTTALRAGFQTADEFQMRDIRLLESRPYCGNHAGPCVVGPGGARERKDGTKARSRCLEGTDWIKVHNAVNSLLDRIRPAYSEAWTSGRGDTTANRIIIRRLNVRRVRWDYREDPNPFGGAPGRRWVAGLCGTPEGDLQFDGPPMDHDNLLWTHEPQYYNAAVQREIIEEAVALARRGG